MKFNVEPAPSVFNDSDLGTGRQGLSKAERGVDRIRSPRLCFRHDDDGFKVSGSGRIGEYSIHQSPPDQAQRESGITQSG